MNSRSETGQFGEELAVKHLENKCFTIIERNFRRKWGELDIIAKAKDKTLVFVEVKTIRQAQSEPCGNAAIPTLRSEQVAESILPEEQLTKAKLRKLQRTASLYANGRDDLIDKDKGWRIDLIAITILGYENWKISHYENI